LLKSVLQLRLSQLAVRLRTPPPCSALLSRAAYSPKPADHVYLDRPAPCPPAAGEHSPPVKAAKQQTNND